MADRLEALLRHFAVRAHMFHSGALCGVNEVPAQAGLGQLHLIKAGPLEVRHAGRSPLKVTEPSLLGTRAFQALFQVGGGPLAGGQNVRNSTTGYTGVGRFIPYDFAVTRNTPSFMPACAASG